MAEAEPSLESSPDDDDWRALLYGTGFYSGGCQRQSIPYLSWWSFELLICSGGVRSGGGGVVCKQLLGILVGGGARDRL